MAGVVRAAGASVSGSVMLVSCEVFMTEGVSKRELASGDIDRRAEACDAGIGSSCYALNYQYTNLLALIPPSCRHTSSTSSTVTFARPLSTSRKTFASEHSFFVAGSNSTSSFSLPSARTESSGLLVGVVPFREGDGVLLVVLFFFRGLPPRPPSPLLAANLVDEGDLGDLVMFRSSDPRARLLVGVTFIVKEENREKYVCSFACVWGGQVRKRASVVAEEDCSENAKGGGGGEGRCTAAA